MKLDGIIQFESYSVKIEGITDQEAMRMNKSFKKREVFIARASNASYVINFDHVLFIELREKKE